MKKLGIILSFLTTLLLVFSATSAWAQQVGRAPDTAFDSVNNRYLMVWEEDTGGGNFQIMGKFLNTDGTDAGVETFRLSPDRPTQGCFYGNFDSDNGDITTPANCPQNLNPSVAYNDGQYLIAWEVHGTANAPATSPENQFINIFARIVDANSLNPISSEWDEGILISKVYIAANNAVACANGKFACNDGEIQAWSQSVNPDVAPRVGAGGFAVTWQTNKDFIGCANSERRRGVSVYARYIDQAFSATSTTNPPMFAIFKDDSTVEEKCAALSNVDNATNPRIAFNQSANDFVVVYELARADGGSASIGAKKVTLNAQNVGEVGGSMMPSILASVDGASLTSPDVVSFKGDYVLFVSDGNNIRAKSFSSSSISNSTPDELNLGDGNQVNPRAFSNLGSSGQGPVVSGENERLVLGYEQDGNIFAAGLNGSLSLTRSPENISNGVATNNQTVELASDLRDFIAVWHGQSSGDKVYAAFVDSEDNIVHPTPTPTGEPPTVPGLLTPDDNVTFAPTRAYLSWSASTDPENGDVTYNVYFGENVIPSTPQVTGVTDTDYVIGPETQSTTGITLEANKVYKWKIEAVDEDFNTTSSPVRTLNTDDSVVAWWRFDEDPTGPVCSGGDPGETVCDYSGNNNHGVPNGGPIWIAPGMPGILGGALDFDGSNDFVSVEDDSSLNLSGSLTFEIFEEPGLTGGVLIARDEAGNLSAGNYQLSVNTTSGGIGFSFYHGVGAEPNRAYSVASSPFTTGNKALISIRHTFGDGTSTEIRVDNSIQTGGWTTGTGDESPITVINFLGIMAKSIDLGGTNNSSGIADEMIIYNKYLNNQELDNGFLSRP